MPSERDKPSDDEIRDLLREIRDDQRLMRESQQKFFDSITELRVAVRKRLEEQRHSVQANLVILALMLLVVAVVIGLAVFGP